MCGSYEILHTLFSKLPPLISGETQDHSELLYKLITAIDLFLINCCTINFWALVFMNYLFLKLYCSRDEAVTILEIENLEELKNRIIKVIIMVLIVSFFERILKISGDFKEPVHMAYLHYQF